MSPSSSPSPPSTGSKHSGSKVPDQGQTSATYQIDIVQRMRVTSDGPLESDEIDQIKNKLERSLQRDLGGYLSSDESSSTKISITETSVNVLRKGGRDRTLSSSASFPSFSFTSTQTLGAAWSPQRHKSQPSQEASSKRAPQRILFYHAHDPYYGFTNFSPDPVEYHGKTYPTSEHLFQSLKARPTTVRFSIFFIIRPIVARRVGSPGKFLPHRPELAEHMRTCSKRPRVVFDEAHRFSPEARPDWLKVRIEMMDLALWHKFTQNTNLKDELLSTGDAELVEVSDAFFSLPLVPQPILRTFLLFASLPKDSDKDAFWGVGPDGKGGNQLGKALQRLRTKLRDASTTANGHGRSKARLI
ncbi:hypothetical protein F5J12DRAFT_891455 [Pisolithus orientalis]|uniref:uncharacterized protein n=1 Tax=Pisolithus orientalis TaxID=936130 RepID=UPI0022253DB9|nr:uncharacterized protein F5J12DRAFT_891455 [Pisolithus orientalis]KAI6010949.1 hypothetical protein F5J12DRAFT_891455 [Pisolithus orientalis]